MSNIGGFVIYDCDIGTDDAWGLLMLIKGERLLQTMADKMTDDNSSKSLPNSYQILGITCVQGNTDVDNCARNALRVLDSVDRLDVSKQKSINLFHEFRFFQRN